MGKHCLQLVLALLLFSPYAWRFSEQTDKKNPCWAVFSIIFKMVDTTNACMLPTRLVSCTDFWAHEQDMRRRACLSCCYVSYHVWQLYRDTYCIVEKCIIAGLPRTPLLPTTPRPLQPATTYATMHHNIINTTLFCATTQARSRTSIFIEMFHFSGVMLAVDVVVEALKDMSKPVTTPEEIAQVKFLMAG